ncbi:4-hydroxy-tetrahydrodipicolinate synthase [Candidatus Uhrbacteria bacterium CG10_big_fil_rev_8_21_14_0_10_48_11]|uniref:4-hydroxy-tetrahydrodipicolinate synthase n=1 Tax=Candidatus Uhrbacteria bacterium CG10_big_fil_rev_8_21_14_0_10_48_11 TaxID=1975037 RepID=A0A2M8LDQ4_9BACT|nr:MAG: 4-hydroxy-tetrahydrodipicolinate synthase [Candidatus Uhrbacteria bacterium CG10_big_fil_rev_8_21_14_0_10_48_11]
MRKQVLFTGVATALVTPFTEDDKIDEVALAAMVERQITAGINALVPCGTTGEAATLSHEEQERVIRVIVEATNGRVPVISGTGSNSTAEAIALTKAAEQAGADGALLISPYYNKPQQRGVVAHYTAVENAVGIPIIVYNIPGRTASKIEAETMARLAAIDGIVAVKDATGSPAEVSRVIENCGQDFAIYSGDDALTLPIISVGGKGVISVTSNLVPEAMVAMVHEMLHGNPRRAQQAHQHLFPLIETLFLETNPCPVKEALALMGQCDCRVRLPLVTVTNTTSEALRRQLLRIGVIE